MLTNGTRRTKNSTPTGSTLSGEPSETHEIVSVTTHPRSGQFRIEISKAENHCFDGQLLPVTDLILNLDGVEAARHMKAGRQGEKEVYEGDIGIREKLFVRIEREPGIFHGSKSKIRVSVNGRLARVFKVRPRRTARHVVFQNVLPCLFLLVALYYSVVYRSAVAHFYSGIFSRQPHQQQKPTTKPSVSPAQPVKSRQLV